MSNHPFILGSALNEDKRRDPAISDNALTPQEQNEKLKYSTDPRFAAPKNLDVDELRGGRRSKKRPTARLRVRRGSSKARKARTTRRK